MKYFIIAALIATAMARPSEHGEHKGGDTFPCLSAANKAAEKTCLDIARNQTNAQSGTTLSPASVFCMPKCVLQQFKALDSTNKVSLVGLTAVITTSNLTSVQKTNATAILRTCLANTTATVTTIMAECFGPNQPPHGPHQGSHHAQGHSGGPAKNNGKNISSDCLAQAKGLACLAKALSINGCGDECATGHKRKQ